MTEYTLAPHTFESFPKIQRLANTTVTITEKIDGTNAAVHFDPYGKLTCQSRKRIITPESDNFGFAAWCADRDEDLFALLGPGLHFGEWWGSGIQRGYGLDHKHFSLFNTHRWSDVNAEILERAPGLDGFVDVVPVLGICQLTVLGQTVSKINAELIAHGSAAAPGFMNPEGSMLYVSGAGYLKNPIDPAPKTLAAAA